MTKFAKGDVVRVHASKFDGDPDNIDELGLTYSQRMLQYWCSFHEVAVCRKYNCKQRHLSEVERQSRDEFGI